MEENEKMTPAELYRLIELPEEVAELYGQWDAEREPKADAELIARILDRQQWEQAEKELEARIGEDPDKVAVLWEELRIAALQWPKWQAKGIPEEIYRDTMAFATRYLKDGMKTYGRWHFSAPWWFPRQLAMELFRVGTLEYELVNEQEETRRVFLHIPTDASLAPEALDDSFRRFRAFAASFYPEWEHAPIFLDSWLMSPAIRSLLPEGSRILALQDRFEFERAEPENMGAVEWEFPGCEGRPFEELPEETTLQKRMKAFLLAGKKPGWAAGRLKKAPEW